MFSVSKFPHHVSFRELHTVLVSAESRNPCRKDWKYFSTARY